MRRALSIFFVLFFGLGPLAAALGASDDARLPPCCRRHGAHHCVLSMRMASMMAQAASGKPIFTAPAQCPSFPGYTAAPTSITLALAPSQAGLPHLLAQPQPPGAGRAAARLSQIRTRAGRGPPASSLS
ncbi:MAG TPA: hypothetical protein VGE83_05825 [Terracidiphilus sp.]|jgi:hypothetical protein